MVLAYKSISATIFAGSKEVILHLLCVFSISSALAQQKYNWRAAADRVLTRSVKIKKNGIDNRRAIALENRSAMSADSKSSKVIMRNITTMALLVVGRKFGNPF